MRCPDAASRISSEHDVTFVLDDYSSRERRHPPAFAYLDCPQGRLMTGAVDAGAHRGRCRSAGLQDFEASRR